MRSTRGVMVGEEMEPLLEAQLNSWELSQFALKHDIILLKCTEIVMTLHKARSPSDLVRVGEMAREDWQARQGE